MEKEIRDILETFKKLDEINLEEEVIVHPMEIKNVMREDVPNRFEMREYLEKLNTEEGFVVGPKVVLEE